MPFESPILALDLATNIGWCYGPPAQSPKEFGHYKLGNRGWGRARKYRLFREWLPMLMLTHKPGLVVFESAAATSTFSGRTTIDNVKWLIGICEHLEEMAYENYELREARVSDVRNYFIGHNPKREIAKRKTVQKCRDYGWDVQTDDEGDACALWTYQVSRLRPDIAAKMTPLFYEGRPVVSKM